MRLHHLNKKMFNITSVVISCLPLNVPCEVTALTTIHKVSSKNMSVKALSGCFCLGNIVLRYPAEIHSILYRLHYYYCFLAIPSYITDII